DEVRSRGARFADGVENGAFDETDHPLGDAFIAHRRIRRDAAHGEVTRPIGGHGAGHDVRAAEIDSDDVLLALDAGHASTLSRETRERTCSATSAGSSSRMHLK